MRTPRGIAVSPNDGKVYVADYATDMQIHVFNADGTHAADVGDAGGIYSGVRGEVRPTKFDYPVGVGIDVSALAGEGARAPLGPWDAARLLFSEEGGYVVEVPLACEAQARVILERRGVWFRRIGQTTAERSLVIEGVSGGPLVVGRGALARAWTNGATEVMR